MRSTTDRIRHAVSFELIGLALITPLGAWAFGLPMVEVGVVGVASATVATIWNYLYNLGFDHAMQRFTGGTQKRFAHRIAHAVLFEAGLVAVLMPLIAWYLGIGLLQAFLMDVSFSIFYLVYAFVFNWLYDRLFPLPEWLPAPEAGETNR